MMVLLVGYIMGELSLSLHLFSGRRSQALLLTLIFAGNLIQSPECHCRKADKRETTIWGWVQESPIEGGRVNRIPGHVLTVDENPIDDVLVEVFNHPEIRLNPKFNANEPNNKQKRIALCKTNEDGEFCFSGIVPGRYEVRASRSGLNAASVIITLDPKSSGDKIKVPINVSM
jgi:hypothetical protein